MRSDYVSTGYVLRKESDNTQILLVKQNKSGKWVPPGGHLKAGEPPHVGLIREVKEETGLNCQIIDLHSMRLDKFNSLIENNTIRFPTPFCIVKENIPKWREDVNHEHVDFIYIMVPENPYAELKIAYSEISNIRWVNVELIEEQDTFPNVISITKSIGLLISEKIISL